RHRLDIGGDCVPRLLPLRDHLPVAISRVIGNDTANAVDGHVDSAALCKTRDFHNHSSASALAVSTSSEVAVALLANSCVEPAFVAKEDTPGAEADVSEIVGATRFCCLKCQL